MKPIQTVYKGFHFRSRLEARWAVFFDALGLTWSYEPEGFEFPDGTKYLPDFWIPCPNYYNAESGYWFEVKGPQPSEEEKRRAKLLARHSGHIVIIAYGDINSEKFCKYSYDPVWSESKIVDVREHHSEEVSESLSAFFATIKHDPSDEPFYSHFSIALRFWIGQRHDDFSHEAFERAVVAARQARFEFGQSGA